MTKRKGTHAHYELMFEDFLRKNNLLYIAINEVKRPIFKGEKVKNFDFIVVTRKGKFLLIDIKGKQFPCGSKNNFWENWITEDDAKFLKMWSNKFGRKATGIIVYAYNLLNKSNQKQFKDTFVYKKNVYGLVAVDVKTYIKNSKPRSSAFKAIYISRGKFPKLIKSISHFLK